MALVLNKVDIPLNKETKPKNIRGHFGELSGEFIKRMASIYRYSIDSFLNSQWEDHKGGMTTGA